MPDALRGPARLLVADDNKVNRLLLQRSLELQGHAVECAANGRVALEMLRQGSYDRMLLGRPDVRIAGSAAPVRGMLRPQC